MATKVKELKASEIEEVSNDASALIDMKKPYMACASIVGTAPILFHRWSIEAEEEKGAGASGNKLADKGAKSKKVDLVDNYVFRNERGDLAIPTEYFRMSIVNAAKFKQDPRSPRKSAMDLFKAAIASGEEFCSLGVKDWDYLDQRRVTIQRTSSITRRRPAMHSGWKCDVLLQVLLPQYVSPELLNEILQEAGRIIGVGDFRPSYGRFQVVSFSVV